ncbi:hypothetical protein DV495_002081 [Geotrichum candidum]|nr:hypothetical protein DV454_003940 [Geotrichum candidum]KAF5114468.1 hypothetical protein DV452_003309 [Geotrichum candidum]KAF5131654.1 hypothetical protein DV495_002081 [Geotrichum candidum]KAI8133154.1 hypothetical protein DUD61_003168 [Geotrichum candidum]
MSYPQRIVQPPSYKLNDLLDAIKQEYEAVTNEASSFRIHKDEFDRKFSQQNAEMQQIKQTVMELELNHRKMKERYEEEILRLKREIETRATQQQQQQQQQQPSQPPHQLLPQQQQNIIQNEQQPPSLGRSGSGVFGGIMAGQPGSLPQQAPPPPQSIPPQGANSFPPYQNGPNGPNGYPTNGAAVPIPPPQQHQPQPPQSSLPQPPTTNSTAAVTTSTAPAANARSTPSNSTNGLHASLSPSSKKRSEASSTPGPTSTATNGQQAGIKTAPSATATPVPAQATTASSTPVPTSQSDMNQLQQQALALGNIFPEFDKVAPEFKKQKDDWFVMYNELAPRRLDVELVHSLEHHSVVCCVRFSADGKYVATGCNRSAQIYDVETGQLVCKLQDDSAEREGDLYIRSVCFSPDGKYLATGAEDKQIRVWDIKTRQIRYLFQGHDQDIYSLDFSRNGKHIASGSGDRTVRMWDMETGKPVLTLSIADGVTTVAISPDGKYVAAGSLDKTVRVWDTSTGFLVERLDAPDGHKDSVYSVAFTPDGKDLVSGSLDKTIKYWELQSPRNIQATHKGGICARTFVGHKDFVLSVASTPDGQWILSGSKDRGVQFWDPRTSQVQLTLQGHKNSVISVAPSPAGGLFATGSGDCKARIWKYFPVS